MDQRTPGAAVPAPLSEAARRTDAVALRTDPVRLAALRATGLLDAGAEQPFDRITRLAVAVLGVPAAFLSLVNEDRDVYLGATGLPEPVASTRELSGETFCHHAIVGESPLVIPDTAADPLYRDVPTVETLGIAAYLGVPLVVDGQTIGAFCAIDITPHAWTFTEIEVLRGLADSALSEIALRRANARLREQAAVLETALADSDRARGEAEARAATLAAVIESIPDAVVVARDDAVVLANEAALAALNVRSAAELRPGRAGDFPLAALLLDRATGAPLPLEATPIGRARGGARSHGQFLLQAMGPAGEPRPVRAAAAPILGPDGTVTGVVAVVTDMTAMQFAASERDRLLAELGAERTLLRTVLDQMPAAVFIVEAPSGRVLALNDAVAQVWGEPRPLTNAVEHYSDEWVGYHSDGRRIASEEWPVARAARGETVTNWTGEIVRADGSRALIEVSAAPVHDSDGRTIAAVAIATDITARAAAARERERLVTEQVEARREIERLLEESELERREAEAARFEAQSANRIKGEFLAVMSHELRTPLNAIGGYVELIELGIRGPVTPQQREDLARIQKSQRHLLGLINGVLNYSRAEAGAVHYDVGDVPLDAVLATCETLIAPQARAKQIALHFSACDEELTVRGDREKLQQIVVNLLSNAVKFTATGGYVTLACAHARDSGVEANVVVTVTDTGRGIATDSLEHVFEPFVQVDTRLTRSEEGIGLGLAISRDLARGMGGDLTAESTLGIGSTFILTLPSA